MGTLGGSPAVYPAMPGMNFGLPKNFIIPPILGNYAQFNYTEGFQQPTMDVQMVPRDVASEVFGSTFLNYFLTRSGTAAYDTSAISGGITFWNGYEGYQFLGAKADSFTVSCQKGQSPIQFSTRWLGTTVNYITGWTSGYTGPAAWALQNLLGFANVNATDTTGTPILPSQIWQFAISFANNHTPDMSLNNSVFPAAQNAGMPTAGMQFRTQVALGNVPDNNPTQFTGGSPNAPVTVSIVVTGTNQSRTFTLNNPIDQARNNRSVPATRVFRDHTYTSLAATSTGMPLTIS
jgi:hypothetical protein